MRINVSKMRVEIILDDLDLHILTSGKDVVMPELGTNDSRSLVIRRAQTLAVKLSSAKKREMQAVELLTGEKILPKEEKIAGFSAPTVAPFSIRGEDIEAGPEMHTQKAFGEEFEASDETDQRRE
jgi:hypothetical protein